MKLQLPNLNLPEFQFKIIKENDVFKLYDEFRKKYIKLTPEEWVRQNFLKHLTENLSYPSTKLKIELNLNLNKLIKRCDAVFFNKQLEPIVLLEFKAPHIKLDQEILDQIGRYNIKLNVRNLIISNGMEHIIIYLNLKEKSWKCSRVIPDFNELKIDD